MKKLVRFAALWVTFTLSACTFSTVADIAPPPGSEVEAPGIQNPTAAPSPTAKIEEPNSTPTTAQGNTAPETGEAAPAEGQPAEGSLLTGQVVNLTGGTVPDALQVVLQGFEDMNIVLTQTTRIDEDGSFAFQLGEDITGLVFIATVEFEELIFGSEVLHSDDLQTGAASEMMIAIYDKTENTEDIYADRVHIFLDFLAENRLQIVEYLLISNPTNLVVAGAAPDEPVLRFTLPENAANLQFEDTGMTTRFIPLESGFGDLMSIRPGVQQHEILFAYELPYDGKSTLELTFPVAVLSGTIVIPDGIKLRSEQVEEAGVREMENGTMQLFDTNELPKGAPLVLNLSGKSGVSAADGTKNNAASLAIGLGILAAVLILSGLWLGRRKKASETPLPEEEPAALTEDELIDEIIALDKAFESGEIDEEDYQTQRSQLKNRLRSMQAE